MTIDEDVSRMIRERVERDERKTAEAIAIFVQRAKFAAVEWSDDCRCPRYAFKHRAERECPTKED